ACVRRVPRRESWRASEGVSGGYVAVFEPIQQLYQRLKDVIACSHLTRVSEHARNMVEVAMLAITMGEARKYAKNAQVALQPHPFVSTMKITEVGCNRQAGSACRFPVTDGPVELLG